MAPIYHIENIGYIGAIPIFYVGTCRPNPYIYRLYGWPLGHKTDKSKRRIVGFGGKVLTDEKSGQFFLGPFLIQPIILFLFVLVFLLLERIWLENAVGGSWAGQICPFLAKNSVWGTITLTKPVVCANRDQKSQKKNHSDHHGVNKKLWICGHRRWRRWHRRREPIVQTVGQRAANLLPKT